MRVHSCCDDRVLLQFELEFLPRGANTSHDLQWILARCNPRTRAVHPCATDAADGPILRVTSSDGIVRAKTVVRITRIYAAPELLEYPGSIRMIVNHCRGYEAVCETAAVALFAEWGQLLEQQIPSSASPSAQQVQGILSSLVPWVCFDKMDREKENYL